MRLQDKAIVVTGSTTGIGESIARWCVAEGANVLVHGRNESRGRQLVEDLDGSAVLHVDDLADPKAPDRLIKRAIAELGRLDGLVNNAARIVRSDIYRTDAALFDAIIAVNVRAPLMIFKVALPHLKRSAASVVNIGSINAYTGAPNQLDYSISKGALMTMSRNLANFHAADQIRINHFNVGWVLTPNERQLMKADGLPESYAEHPDRQFVPAGRMTRPEEIAAHAVFWLSDDSRPITGSVIDLEQYPVIGRNPLK